MTARTKFSEMTEEEWGEYADRRADSFTDEELVEWEAEWDRRLWDPANLAAMTETELMAVMGPDDMTEAERLAMATELRRRGLKADAHRAWWSRPKEARAADREAMFAAYRRRS